MKRRIGHMRALITFLLSATIMVVHCSMAIQRAEAAEGSTFTDIYRGKASEYEKVGELRKAILMWEIVSGLAPEDREAVKKIDELRRLAVVEAEDHFRKGEAHYKKGSAAAARKEFLLALLYNPDHPTALDYLKNKLPGDDYTLYEVKKGDTLQSISQKLYRDPQKNFLISVFNNLDKQGKVTPGMTLKLPIIEVAVPKRASDEAYWKPSETEEEPTAKTVDAEGLLAKANSLLKARKYQEALAAAEKVLEHDGKNAGALELVNASNYQMGKMLNDKKNYKEALVYFNRVDPGYLDVKDIKSLAQNRLAEYHYNSGVKFFVNDELEKAIHEWEEALALNPRHPKARKDVENAQNLLRKLQELK